MVLLVEHESHVHASLVRKKRAGLFEHGVVDALPDVVLHLRLAHPETVCGLGDPLDEDAPCIR